MKIFDVTGTTIYVGQNTADMNADDIEAMIRDCENVVLHSAFEHHLLDVAQIDNAIRELNDGVPIDWIVTITAENVEDAERMLRSSQEVGKQFSYIYEIADVSDEAGW